MDPRWQLSNAGRTPVDRQSGASLRVFRMDLDDRERLTVSLLASLGSKKTLAMVEHLRELADYLEAGAHPLVGEVVARRELIRVGVAIRRASESSRDAAESDALLRRCRDD